MADRKRSEQVADRLTLLDHAGKPRQGPFVIVEFDTPSGVASPVNRTNPGFVGLGRTAGGAPEFVVPNLSMRDLSSVTIRRVE